MTRYHVNATVSFAAWVEMEADSEEDAVQEARGLDASMFEYDTGTGEIDFNVTPEVEASPW